MFMIPNGKLTNLQILLPVSLLSFIVFLMLAFQATQIASDRVTLKNALAQQEKPLADAQRVQKQLSALASGTVTLAQKGDKNAKAIVDRLKQMGVIGPAPAPGGTPAAAATTLEPSAPAAPAKP